MIDAGEQGELYEAIRKYIVLMREPSSEVVDRIRDLLGTPACPDYFSEPARGSLLRRGLTVVSEEMLRKILGGETGRIPTAGSLDFDGFIRPRGDRVIMSFTHNEGVSREFARSRVPNFYRVIFTAAASDNPGMFLDLTRGFYASSPAFVSKYSREEEVIALGPVKINKIEWWLDHSLYPDPESMYG